MVEKIRAAVSRHREAILEAERYIWKNPETGYREVKTTAYLAEKFEALGYQLTMADGIPGFYTEGDTGREGPTLLILGELDSVICPTHPEADPETGAVHSCGHNVQCAALLGIAAALREPGMTDGLSGKIRLCAVPAEELLEIGYRQGLFDEGRIRYFGGKCEFLARGYFDGVDLALLVHASQRFWAFGGMVGCMAKSITYRGRAAHAGGAPWAGCNALYAATAGLSAVNAIRETFREADLIRVHPIVTHGGDMVNAIPERVELESYVRGKTFAAIVEANRKVNRALTGGALSLGANIEIADIPGYSPLVNNKGLLDTVREAYRMLFPGEEMAYTQDFSTGSSDLGDLSSVMPVVHPYVAATTGTMHGADFYITNPEAPVTSAEWQLVMVRLLLGEGAARARGIVAEYEPPFASKEEFLAYKDSLGTSGDRILYREDGGAEILL